MENKEEDFAKEISEEEITSLFKNFLDIVRDVYEDHTSLMERLKYNYPELEKVINTSDSFDRVKFTQIRKRVLDMGNDAIRNRARRVEQVKVVFRKNEH